MIPILASIIVPITIYLLLPMIAEKNAHSKKYRLILLAGCLIYAVAWYLPSPLIDGMDTAFWTHFSGGVATGFIWLYLVKTGFWRLKGVIKQMIGLYVLVSSLGVLNELAEFILVKLHLFPITLADTSWDLVTNTLGAASFFVAYLAVNLATRK